MAIPKISRQDIDNALKFISENGVPHHYQSTKYELVTDDGNSYPPKYVIALADHLANGAIISTKGFNPTEAINLLRECGYTVVSNQEKFELTISADRIVSTDDRFTMDDLSLGDNYKPLDAYFKKANGVKIKRIKRKNEKNVSNQTLPRLACQVFEEQLEGMPAEEKDRFPICKYKPSGEVISGIYPSVDEYKKRRNSKSWEYSVYTSKSGKEIVFYSWNVFSTIIFVQECLKRFGKSGDQFVLTYSEKGENEEQLPKTPKTKEPIENSIGIKNLYSKMLIESKNLIFHGAPGTGKSYLAKRIAADIISNGTVDDYASLTDEQKKQVEFVQFHPSYDYSDFVEGLRPRINGDGTMGFELQDGIFKRFITRARKNLEDSQKTQETIEKEVSVQDSIMDFFSGIEFGVDTFYTINGNEFSITSVDDRHINISIPGNATVNKLSLNMDEIRRMLESDVKFTKIKDVTAFFGKTFATQGFSYDYTIYKAIKARKCASSKAKAKQEEQKRFVFIIDEINRGEISKIFGELFFAIDPDYRGRAGEVSTQYSNMHYDPDDKFYVPDNVYIIGTMNDIDRSVDSFDFAMRRRFRFVKLKANEQITMLDSLNDEKVKSEAVSRMTALNIEIAKTPDLNDNYQIGASYFLKLRALSSDQLWTDFLEPLLHDYVQGFYEEEDIMRRFAKAYGYQNPNAGDAGEA